MTKRVLKSTAMSFFSSRNSGTPSGVNPDKIDDAIAQWVLEFS